MSNNTTTSGPIDSSSAKQFNVFAIAFGISIGGLSVIAIMILASYVCTRKPGPAAGHEGSLSTDDQDSVVIEIGLDEATLSTYPKLLYSEAKREKGDSIPSCCSICLADYVDSDSLRVLPDCDHLFHVQCIDPWLKLHPTCPICRNSPVSLSPSNGHLPRERAAPTRLVFFDTWFVQFMH